MLVKPSRDIVNKVTAAAKVTESKSADVTAQQKDIERSLTAAPASASESVDVDEYRAKMAEKRRLAREKAELEAAQQEETRRQRQ